MEIHNKETNTRYNIREQSSSKDKKCKGCDLQLSPDAIKLGYKHCSSCGAYLAK